MVSDDRLELERRIIGPDIAALNTECLFSSETLGSPSSTVYQYY